ncbi:MAG: hypothetical protein J6K75_06455 [Erysipelotrichaceae bacterium]|nr:hypothetical protein [Erysipelotrichaceae bacterium]
MKKLICLCLLLFLFPLHIQADVIAEPWGDEFYIDHQEEMTIEYRYYETTSEINIMESPVSDIVKGKVETGRIIHVEFLYTDEQGTLWGMQVLRNDKGAWFKMEHLKPVKGHNDFINEHPELIEIEKTRSFDEDGWLTLYRYPGSSIINSSFEAKWTRDDKYPLTYTYEYTDEQGNLWIYVPFFEHNEGWINTSEPLKTEYQYNTSTELNPDGSPISTLVPESSAESETQTPNENDVTDETVETEDGSLDEYIENNHHETLITVLVVSVCLLTGILAWIQYRRKCDAHV